MQDGDRVLVQSKFPDSKIQEEYGTVTDVLSFIVKVKLDNGSFMWLSLDIYEVTVIT